MCDCSIHPQGMSEQLLLVFEGASPLRRYLQANTRLPPMRGSAPQRPGSGMIQTFLPGDVGVSPAKKLGDACASFLGTRASRPRKNLVTNAPPSWGRGRLVREKTWGRGRLAREKTNN